MLSDDESDDEHAIHDLTINEHFAKAYAAKKEREELSKLKDRYGSDAEEDVEDSDDSESETEDEDGEELTPAVDAAILRTLARIRKKDPAIYEKGNAVFDEEQARTRTSVKTRRKDKSKPVKYKELVLSSILQPTSRSPSPRGPTHVEEQAALRDETISAFHGALAGGDGDDDDDDDDLLVPRERVLDESEQMQEEYRTFLEREVGEDIQELIAGGDDHGSDDLSEGEVLPKAKAKNKRKKGKQAANDMSEADQKFLLDYIVNRGWMDKASGHVPTYGEIVGTKSSKSNANAESRSADEGEGALGEDPENLEEFDDVADLFETSYNFRFEEPGSSTIPTFPRKIPTLVRREDTVRKEARERRKQRKEEEKMKMKEEIKRMKALKLKELRAKLERIGKEAGSELGPEAFEVLDLDAEWDPQAHDRQMAGIYDGEELDNEDIEKPQWADDIDIDDIIPETKAASKQKKKKRKKDAAEDEDAGVDMTAMDADIAPSAETWDGTEEERKRILDKYMAEIDALHFNDMIGDMPTRFKYTSVSADTFGLTPSEILLATDRELNGYIGVKKYAPYRKGSKWEHGRGDRLRALKESLRGRKWDENGEALGDKEAAHKPKKRKGRKEREREKTGGDVVDADLGVAADGDDGLDLRSDGEVTRPKKRRRKSKQDAGEASVV